jgi:predicted metallopeptidase
MRWPPLEVEILSSNFDDLYTKDKVDIVVEDEAIIPEFIFKNRKRSQSAPLRRKQLTPD